MANLTLWETLNALKSPKYKWVDLSHELSPETPHWFGFKPLGEEKLFDYDKNVNHESWEEAPMRVFQYSLPGQYGTHVDCPVHFDGKGRSQEKITVQEMVYPLCVIDKSAAVAANSEYTLTVQDILDWEAEHGKVPQGAFVAFRSDICHRPKDNLDGNDANGVAHYPGWALEAIQFLVEQRSVGAIGHEASDTDPSYVTQDESRYPYPGEQYILQQDRIQIELLANLDQCPAVGGIIVCAFPKLKDGTGFSARCFAICPAD